MQPLLEQTPFLSYFSAKSKRGETVKNRRCQGQNQPAKVGAPLAGDG